MKTLLIIFTTLCIAGGVIYYSMPKTSQTEVSVMQDITSFHIAQPDSAAVVPLLNLSDSLWNGADFRFQYISNVSFNPVKEVSIPSANEWLSNNFERKKAVTAFYSGVEKIFEDSTEDDIGKEHSSVYLPIARELTLLSQSKAQHKILVVYSDLMENDITYSFYCNKIFALLKSNPNAVIKHFQSEAPLPNLQGIQVYLVFVPANSWQDLQFQTVSGFYKNMLQAAGAQVTITANLTN